VRPAAGQPAVRFGVFLDECVTNLGLSRAEFARQLGIEPELADAILDGLLPESEIGDELLVEIASVVRYEPDLFRIMLERSIEPARHGQDVKMRRREES
jgi:hypothetical protein